MKKYITLLLISIILISCASTPRQIHLNNISPNNNESGINGAKKLVFDNSIIYSSDQSKITLREEKLNDIIFSLNCSYLLNNPELTITLVSYNNYEYGDKNYNSALESYKNRKLQLSRLNEIKQNLIEKGVSEKQIKQSRYQVATGYSNRIDLIYDNQSKNKISGYVYNGISAPIISINHKSS